jgi:hypothetical protein
LRNTRLGRENARFCFSPKRVVGNPYIPPGRVPHYEQQKKKNAKLYAFINVSSPITVGIMVTWESKMAMRRMNYLGESEEPKSMSL